MTSSEHHSLVIDSPIGRLIVIEVADALVRLSWADRQADDPQAYPVTSEVLTRAAEQLDDYFAGARRTFELPLAPQGTAFQCRVWTEMARIPFGETLSYGQLAHRVGSVPRAIGQACKTNPIPIVIPCHRVLAEGGGTGGYSGGDGVETKLALLSLEGAHQPTRDLFGEEPPVSASTR